MEGSYGRDITADGSALLADYRAGCADPVTEVERSLVTFDRVGADLNAAIIVLGDQARLAAQESVRRYRDGTARSLEGLPVGIKDIIAVGGVPLTAGSRVLAGHVPPRDADVVRRLRVAGALVIAKLATFAFANGDPVNVDFGVTRNPADPAHLAGGSSSGSAAAVGSGCVPVALGSDTGGSIRLPAAYCGLAGIKPTFGRVPRDGVLPLAWTLDHVGPLTRTVRDLRLVLPILGDPAARRPPPAVPTVPVGLRVGVPDSYFLDRLDATTASAFDSALRALSAAGARVVHVHVPDLNLAEPVGRTIITAEMASLHEQFADRAAHYDDLLGARLAAADKVLATDYLKAQRLRVLLDRNVTATFAHCDVLATPTTPTVAPRIDSLTVRAAGKTVPWLDVAARNTFPFNLTGMPAVTVPMQTSGLPVGLQLAGPMWSDSFVLDVAEWFEGLRDDDA